MSSLKELLNNKIYKNIRIFITPKSNNDSNINSLNIEQDIFENALFNFNEQDKYKVRKNNYKLYRYNDLNLKLFNDGSCYCFKNEENSFRKLNFEDFDANIVMKNEKLLKNDDFPGLLDYHGVDENNEIIYTIDENSSIIFSLVTNQNNYQKYFIYINIENKDKKKIDYCDLDNLFTTIC